MERRNESSDESVASPHEAGVPSPGAEAAGSEAAAQARQARPKRKSPAVVEKKGVPTARSRRKALAAEKRTTPVQFVNESVDELKKVVWPTPLQVRRYFAVVLAFVLAIIAYVGGLDLLFGWVLLKLFG